jgi:hypothetical protein
MLTTPKKSRDSYFGIDGELFDELIKHRNISWHWLFFKLLNIDTLPCFGWHLSTNVVGSLLLYVCNSAQLFN